MERRGNLERATVFEFDHYVYKPRTAWQERKDAQVHFWSFPREYFGWYTSAKVHSFKRRIPWKVFAALAFIPIAAFIAWRVISSVGGIQQGILPTEMTQATNGGAIQKTTDAAQWDAQFKPVNAWQPFSAPAYQGRKVVSDPEMWCMFSGAGKDANGEHRAASCTCLSEQGTRIMLDNLQCKLVATSGVYNPYRKPQRDEARETREPGHKLGEARLGPSSVASAASTAAASFGNVATYGGMGVGAANGDASTISP